MARAPGAEGSRSVAAGPVADELNLLIDGALDYAIYMIDPGGHVTIWNKGAERLKGWTEAEALGQHIALFYPHDQVEQGKPAHDLAVARARGRLEEEAWRLRAPKRVVAAYDAER